MPPFLLNRTALWIKDPQLSVPFYETLGMTLVAEAPTPDGKVMAYLLGINVPADLHWSQQIGLIELLHLPGSESDDSFAINSGNGSEFRGYGHVCISVDNVQAACEQLEKKKNLTWKKRLHEGRMRKIAFLLDPDGYWVEILAQRPVDETKHIKTTSSESYRMNHTMIRVKDAEKTLDFYQNVLGMSFISRENSPPEMSGKDGYSLYFLGYNFRVGQDEQCKATGLIEFTHNHTTESDDNFSYHASGKRGFAHFVISVENYDAVAKGIEAKGVKVTLISEPIKGIAFYDPDGYEIHVSPQMRA